MWETLALIGCGALVLILGWVLYARAKGEAAKATERAKTLEKGNVTEKEASEAAAKHREELADAWADAGVPDDPADDSSASV